MFVFAGCFRTGSSNRKTKRRCWRSWTRRSRRCIARVSVTTRQTLGQWCKSSFTPPTPDNTHAWQFVGLHYFKGVKQKRHEICPSFPKMGLINCVRSKYTLLEKWGLRSNRRCLLLQRCTTPGIACKHYCSIPPSHLTYVRKQSEIWVTKSLIQIDALISMYNLNPSWWNLFCIKN